MKLFREKLKKGPLIGSFITFPSPGLSEYISSLGFDFIVIDNEHASINEETIENMIRASNTYNVPSIVRVPDIQRSNIQHSLDCGAQGIQVPHVNTKSDLEKVVSLSKYPPEGNRGAAFLTKAAGYGSVTSKNDYIKNANKGSLIVTHVETKESIENLDEMLAVNEIDVFFIGPGDLSVSLGYADNTSDHQFVETIENAILKIKDSGKIIGTFTNNAEQTNKMIDLGVNYILTAATSFMGASTKEFLQQVNKREK